MYMNRFDKATSTTLYSLAMGDAYGVGFEFMEPEHISKNYLDQPKTSIGGGPFAFSPGEFSDDTEMAALTLTSVMREGYVNITKITQLYILWAQVAKDIGIQTKSALLDNYIDTRGEGNGTLMRILPTVVYMHETFGWDSTQIKHEVVRISSITHDNHTIHAINNFFIDLMLGNSLEHHAHLMQTFSATTGNDGWVMNTARIVYEMYQRSNMPLLDGFWEIIKYGGDTDTACAIYGALLCYQNPTLVTDDLLERLLSHTALKQLQQLTSTELYTYIPEPFQTLLVAGQYPGSRGRITHTLKMAAIVNLEIDAIINLMEIDELMRFAPYQKALEHIMPNLKVHHLPIRDMDIPDDLMLQTILDTMENDIANGKRVYVHCWGGHGRTGTVVGSWLVRQGMSAEEALDQIKSQRCLTAFGDAPSPQTPEQINVIIRLSQMMERK
jgi:ADP-ribosylglycohydrolase/protein-tyrosine phosphatase